MRALRFSLTALLAAVLALALGLGALVNATNLLASLFATAVALIVLVAVLATVYSAQGSRAFWLGFAVFGGCWLFPFIRVSPATDDLLRYLHTKVRRLQPPRENATTVWFRSDSTVLIGEKVVTLGNAKDELARHLKQTGRKHVRVYRDEEIDDEDERLKDAMDDIELAAENLGSATHEGEPPPFIPDIVPFVWVGQSLSALIFAFVGGVVGRVLYERQRRTRQTGGDLPVRDAGI